MDAAWIPAAEMPAPRLQLRWEQIGEERFFCHYELVLPLNKLDIRREDGSGKAVRSELIVALSKGTRAFGDPPSHGHPPYRDGVHAFWDAAHLGNPPIFVVYEGRAYRHQPRGKQTND